MTQYSPRGSLWNRWDLHFHTPSSFDYEDSSVTNNQIVESLIENGVRVIAVTDHHKIDVDRIIELQQLGRDRLTVLPGIELRTDHGDKPVHYICIFSETCDLRDIWTRFSGTLGLTDRGIREKGGDESIYVPIEDGAKLARQLGGVVSIHAGAKSNSIEQISNAEQFQQRIKYDIVNDWVDILEIGQLKDIEIHYKIIFKNTGLSKPLIVCSDNHSIKNYKSRVPLWFRADPTFRGLRMVIGEPRGRVYLGERPPELIRVEQNPTKYIRKLGFQRVGDAGVSEKWFSGSLEFNFGLIAIIGNKGSGKSALADVIGLLGATRNGENFSFLTSERFRHPTSNLASGFDATIAWESGEEFSDCLANQISKEAVERVKYLPQKYVEKVCNELSGLGEKGFEQELKAVIFSHVPESQRLSQRSLDELVRFKAEEKQRRIDSLIKQLKDLSRRRALIEQQADPKEKRAIEEKIKRKESELSAHEHIRPKQIEDPSTGSTAAPIDSTLISEITETEAILKDFEMKIQNAEKTIAQDERRSVLAIRLLERLTNFEKEFAVFKESLREDAEELGITPTSLALLSIEKVQIEKLRDESLLRLSESKSSLVGSDGTGLRAQLAQSKEKLERLKATMDAPNRAYQNYLQQLKEWESRKAEILGTESENESLNGLRKLISNLEQLPAQVQQLRAQQSEVAATIHQQKMEQVNIFKSLYEPVQQFIQTHEIAQDKLQLQFEARLTEEQFPERFLSILNLNRRGSFMGLEDGKTKVESFSKASDWDKKESTLSFLENIDEALHADQRDGTSMPVQLTDQLKQGRKAEEIFDFLYGLEYLNPRYILRWEGKDLARLSPGERGTLLLAFYLLIDKGDTPLIIDQPEENLDNHTVAKILVDCIREARKRRQVFIVTHNPNLAVVCDADQVIHASIDKEDGNAVTYVSGSLENPSMTRFLTDVLEGTRWAFGVRGQKYEVGEAEA